MSIDANLELWRLAKVCDRIGVSPSTIWRWVEDGTFPEPRRIGANAVAWRSDEVLDWMDRLPPASGPAGTPTAPQGG